MCVVIPNERNGLFILSKLFYKIIANIINLFNLFIAWRHWSICKGRLLYSVLN